MQESISFTFGRVSASLQGMGHTIVQELFALINEQTVIFYWFDFETLRICKLDDMHTEMMTTHFAGSLRRSYQLQSLRPVVFSHTPFELDQVERKIITTKQIPQQERLAIVNIRLCLKSMNFVNTVHSTVHLLTTTAFDDMNHTHIDLIETLWTSLKPDMRRVSYVSRANEPVAKLASSDWSDIGFQGIYIIYIYWIVLFFDNT